MVKQTSTIVRVSKLKSPKVKKQLLHSGPLFTLIEHGNLIFLYFGLRTRKKKRTNLNLDPLLLKIPVLTTTKQVRNTQTVVVLRLPIHFGSETSSYLASN